MSSLRPLNDKVIVRRLDAEEKTKGGIILPEKAKEKPREGIVKAVGDGKLLDNGKRASMVLAIDFSRKDGDVSRQNMLGYTAYFHRDPGGLFFFPGQFDSRSVRRSAKDLQRYEFTNLSGQLKNGAQIVIRTAGDNNPPEGHTRLGWNLRLNVVLRAVE